jgi:hypothetical protein
MENSLNPSQSPYPQYSQVYSPPRKPVLPHSITTLVFGIVSLATMAWFGWIMGIVAMHQGSKALQAAEDEPEKYNETTIRMARAGKNMGVIGLILGLLGILVWILYFVAIFYFISLAEHHTYDYNYY